MPTPATNTGMPPPCAAYSSSLRPVDSLNVVPRSSYLTFVARVERWYRSTVRRLRASQSSESGMEPGSAAR